MSHGFAWGLQSALDRIRVWCGGRSQSVDNAYTVRLTSTLQHQMPSFQPTGCCVRVPAATISAAGSRSAWAIRSATPRTASAGTQSCPGWWPALRLGARSGNQAPATPATDVDPPYRGFENYLPFTDKRYIVKCMIQSFKCPDTHALFLTGKCKRWVTIKAVAERKLQQLDSAATLDFLKSPPGSCLEALVKDRIGQHSIRINLQWRVCFVWTPLGPMDVEIVH